MIYLSSFISLRWHNHITGRPGTKTKEYNKAIRKLFVLQLSVKWNRRSGDAYLCCWRHDMGLFSTCLVLCEENPLNKWSVMRSFDLFFAVSPSKLLSKPSICRWRRDTQVTSLWWHRNSVKQDILFLTKNRNNQLKSSVLTCRPRLLFQRWWERCLIECYLQNIQCQRYCYDQITTSKRTVYWCLVINHDNYSGPIIANQCLVTTGAFWKYGSTNVNKTFRDHLGVVQNNNWLIFV